MYHLPPFTGLSLPPRTLCLTYDDGPGIRETGSTSGPRTEALSNYLHGLGVRATFFVAGKHAALYPRLMQNLQTRGHLVANHTFYHPNLRDLHNIGGDVTAEILQTDAIIRQYISSPTIFFRAPYLTCPPEVIPRLNNNILTALHHVGPIDSAPDLFIEDYAYWRDGRTPKEVAGMWIRQFEQAEHDKNPKRGIMLMHDSTGDSDEMRTQNRTYDFTRLLIPSLQRMGYTFVRLDEIPEIITAAEQPLIGGLRASNGLLLSAQNGGGGEIYVNGPRFDSWERIEVQYIAPGKVALKAPNGQFYSAQNGGSGLVLANGPRISNWERFDAIPVGPEKVAFRTHQGKYLTRESASGGRLMATASGMNGWEVFSFEAIIYS